MDFSGVKVIGPVAPVLLYLTHHSQKTIIQQYYMECSIVDQTDGTKASMNDASGTAIK